MLRPSVLGVTVDAVDLGRATALGEPVATRIDDRYPWRGVKSTAVNRCNAYAIPVITEAGGFTYSGMPISACWVVLGEAEAYSLKVAVRRLGFSSKPRASGADLQTTSAAWRACMQAPSLSTMQIPNAASLSIRTSFRPFPRVIVLETPR